LPSVESLVKDGWTIIADGPSGTQLQAPRKMRASDSVLLLIGVLCGVFVSLILGAALVCAALVDYWFLVKPETVFLARKETKT